MRVLIACEFSGVVRDAFLARGHEAWSCDLLPAKGTRAGNHIVGDALKAARGWFEGYDIRAGRSGTMFRQWDLMIAHPPCTYLSVSGLHWNKRRPERAALTAQAYEFFMALWNADIPRIAIENPIGCMSRLFRKPDQIVQPYQFGHDASKATCLWLKNLAPLVIDPDKRCAGRIVTRPDGRTVERWANQTDSGQNRLPPSPDRAAIRSTTFEGIAEAMAEQWGSLA